MIEQAFKNSGALTKGHFLLTSGLHSDVYIDKFKLISDPRYCEIVCQEMAEPFLNKGITLVIGPAMGGLILAYNVAKILGAKSAFLEREDGLLKLRRFKIKPTDKILLIEDVVTTGKSVNEMLEALKKFKKKIVGISYIADRYGKSLSLGIKTHRLIDIKAESWDAKDCGLCKVNIPLIKPGSR